MPRKTQGRTCFYCPKWLNNEDDQKKHYEDVHADLAVWESSKKNRYGSDYSWLCTLCYMEGEHTSVNLQNYAMHMSGRHDEHLRTESDNSLAASWEGYDANNRS